MAKSYKKYAKPVTTFDMFTGNMTTAEPDTPRYKAKPKPKVPYVHPP